MCIVDFSGDWLPLPVKDVSEVFGGRVGCNGADSSKKGKGIGAKSIQADVDNASDTPAGSADLHTSAPSLHPHPPRGDAYVASPVRGDANAEKFDLVSLWQSGKLWKAK